MFDVRWRLPLLLACSNSFIKIKLLLSKKRLDCIFDITKLNCKVNAKKWLGNKLEIKNIHWRNHFWLKFHPRGTNSCLTCPILITICWFANGTNINLDINPSKFHIQSIWYRPYDMVYNQRTCCKLKNPNLEKNNLLMPLWRSINDCLIDRQRKAN